MKVKRKSLGNFFRRVGALISSFLMICCLTVSVFAVSDTEADMPSKADFFSHQGSWFVWRTRTLSGYSYYELCSGPVLTDSSGAVISSPAYSHRSTSYFDVPVIYGSDLRNYYACALPVPFYGVSGLWSELPSFPVGSANNGLTCSVSLYATSSWFESPYYAFLSPCYSSSSTSVTFSNTIGSSSDSIFAAEFPSPLYSFPFAYRTGSSSTNSSYSVLGGNSNCISTSKNDDLTISFGTNKFMVKPEVFSTYPYSYSCASSDLGLVVIKKLSVPSTGTINSASLFAPSSPFFLVPTLLVPAGFLPDVKIGDWLSDSPEDLQKALTNEFNVDSGTLKDSKQNFDSWQNSNTIDTDVANTSLDVVNAMMQNVGQFVAIVSLLCFGAVVLRVLIRKAVEG